ncbi:hypothetical protein [Azospirillum sp. TSO35-2]|uniref:hypothetical protein n=1 Tax=Azospirillum sp. TSO35-2 TaxID=716796 RepID=UPI0011B4F6E1|nr:hypothetical protein [Azospirillum sp. TSO35-2]
MARHLHTPTLLQGRPRLGPLTYAGLLAAGALLALVADHALDGWARVAGMSAGGALCLVLPILLALDSSDAPLPGRLRSRTGRRPDR